MLPLGTEAPDFSLSDTEGNQVELSRLSLGKGLWVMFICNHCPYVRHIASELGRLATEAQSLGLTVVAINSNDIENFPEDRPELMRLERQKQGWTFPYLFDASQAVAKAYQAACTPDFFLFDKNRRLVYRGQFDAARPSNSVAVTGEDMRRAIHAVAKGQAIDPKQVPSIGCNIKWRPGNAPKYFG